MSKGWMAALVAACLAFGIASAAGASPPPTGSDAPEPLPPVAKEVGRRGPPG